MNKKNVHHPFPVWPQYEQDEINAVVEVLQSGKNNAWVGDQVLSFEREFASFIGAPYAIAVCNGSVALELALYSMGIGPGDDVIVPCKSFIASASSVVMRGARPLFADIDPQSQNITIGTIKKVITPKTRAIIVVHFAGWPCEIESICKYARQNKLKVIEDCAQAHGAKYKGKYVGSFGDAAAFSFCHDKIMTMGEGGILLLRDKEKWLRAWSYKDHGKDYNVTRNQSDKFAFQWVHNSFGTNWRLTEMQAAIGRVQLKKLPQWTIKRRSNAQALILDLKDIPGIRIYEPLEYIEHAYYRCYAFIDKNQLQPGWNRDKIVKEINNKGVPCFEGSCSEIYLEKAFVNARFTPSERLPTGRRLAEESICFLVHPTLNKKDITDISNIISSILVVALKNVA